MKYFLFVLSAGALIISISCSSTPGRPDAAPSADDEMISKSHEDQPEWLYTEPESDSEYHYFTGMSAKMATEKNGREDALNNALQNVVKYLGSAYEERLQKISTSYGLSSEIIDPTEASRNFQENTTKGLAKKVKAKSYYIEKWKTSADEAYYLVRLLTKVPRSAVDEAFDDTIDSELERLKSERDKINDQKARAQFEKAMDAFKKAKEEGFDLDR